MYCTLARGGSDSVKRATAQRPRPPRGAPPPVRSKCSANRPGDTGYRGNRNATARTSTVVGCADEQRRVVCPADRSLPGNRRTVALVGRKALTTYTVHIHAQRTARSSSEHYFLIILYYIILNAFKLYFCRFARANVLSYNIFFFFFILSS